MRTRAFAIVVTIAMIYATLLPLVRRPTDDDFPLSTYPMFAFARPTRLTMSYAVGITKDGRRRYLLPVMVGSREVLQARAIIERGVGGGPRERLALCTRIAANIRSYDDFDDIATIAIVTGTHDAVEFLVRDKGGVEQERVRCEVKR